MKRKTSKGLALLTASAVAAVTVLGTGTPAAQAAEAEYEIYPKPHEISYEEDSWILKNEVNVVYPEKYKVGRGRSRDREAPSKEEQELSSLED